MRLLIVGAGSTGGYFGGRLMQAGRDVTFLVRPQRAAQLRDKGLVIVSPKGDAVLQPKIVTASDLREHFDAILLTVKSFGLDAALNDLAPAVGPDTAILPVLNGMRHLDIIKSRFGEKAAGGCVCKVATTLDDDGRIIHLTRLQDIAYGEMNGETSARMAAIDAFMTGAGFDARLTPDIAREMWEKWLLLASLGAVTCLMRGPVGAVEAAPGGRDFILGVLDEVVTTLSAVGIAPRDTITALVRSQLTEAGSGMTSSMYRDLTAGRPVEADAIVGDLVARAQAAGIATPLLAAAYAHLSVYSAGRPT